MRIAWSRKLRPTLTLFSKSALHVHKEEEDMKQLEFKKTIGICPECGHHVRVNRNGNVGSHKVGVTEPTYCPGNGERPLKIVAQYDY